MSESPWPETCMFREHKKTKWWRIQTTDPKIIRKLSRKKGFRLAAECLTSRMRVYAFERYRPEYARRSFSRVVGGNLIFEEATDTYWPETPPRVDKLYAPVTSRAGAES